MVLRNALQGSEWELDDDRKNTMMDLRLRCGDLVVGIECKDRKQITTADLDKFNRDRTLHGFLRSVFVSTAPIPTILSDPDSLMLNEDELWIYTTNPAYLAAALGSFVQALPTAGADQVDDMVELKMVLDNMNTLYKAWQSVKKEQAKMDKVFLAALHAANIPMPARHVYIKTKTGKYYTPYE